MLVMSRGVGERIMIDGGKIILTVTQISPGTVRIGLEADRTIRIDREETHWRRLEKAAAEPVLPARSVALAIHEEVGVRRCV